MKDKLRELVADCRKPYPACEHDGRYADGYNDANNDVADRLAAILDAEGVAVPIGYADPRSIQGYTLGQYGDFRVSDQSKLCSVPLYDHTHPARSGVVSDEEVEAACRKYYNCGHPVYPPVFEGMRAALEHFARRTP